MRAACTCSSLSIITTLTHRGGFCGQHSSLTHSTLTLTPYCILEPHACACFRIATCQIALNVRFLLSVLARPRFCVFVLDLDNPRFFGTPARVQNPRPSAPLCRDVPGSSAFNRFLWLNTRYTPLARLRTCTRHSRSMCSPFVRSPFVVLRRPSVQIHPHPSRACSTSMRQPFAPYSTSNPTQPRPTVSHGMMFVCLPARALRRAQAATHSSLPTTVTRLCTSMACSCDVSVCNNTFFPPQKPFRTLPAASYMWFRLKWARHARTMALIDNASCCRTQGDF